MLSALSLGSEMPPNFPLPSLTHPPVPHLPVLRSKAFPFTFGLTSLHEHRTLIKRLDAERSQCVYVLLGQSADRPVARGGMTKEPLVRLGTHLGTSEFRHFTHVAVVTGPHLTDKDVAALECLVLRQIAAVGAANPGCKGPEMLKIPPAAWNTALDAFLFLRWGLMRARIIFLEPRFPQDPASLIATASGIRERWANNAFDARKNLVGGGGVPGGEKFEFDRGDFVTIAEKRGQHYCLLKGSEIRATAVASARIKDRRARKQLFESGWADHVRGFPDRLELLVDLNVGSTVDRLTKFVMGSACSENHWRPFVPKTLKQTNANRTFALEASL